MWLKIKRSEGLTAGFGIYMFPLTRVQAILVFWRFRVSSDSYFSFGSWRVLVLDVACKLGSQGQ